MSRVPLLLLAACAVAAAGVSYRIETVAGSDPALDGIPALMAQLNPPQGIAVDRQGNVYVAETDSHRIRKITPSGRIYTVAGTGKAGAGGDGGPAAGAELNLPYGLAVDGAGNLFVADLANHRVRRIGTDGLIATVAGTGEKGSRGDGGPATAAQLMSPRNVALDAAGNLYIAEFEGHRIRRVTRDGRISTYAGTGVAGMSGDGGPAAAAQLNAPAGLAFDPNGVLYIADTQNRRVRSVPPSGVIFTFLGGSDGPDLGLPVALASDGQYLYVLERALPYIRRFRSRTIFEIYAGTTVPGYGGDGGWAKDARLSAALADLVLDAAGNMYLADGRRVRKVARNGTIARVAGDAYTAAVGDGGPAVRAHLNEPSGLAMDLPGNLYIADAGTNRIRRLSRDGLISTVAGAGAAGFAGDGGLAAAALLTRPRGVAVEASGNLFIADTGNDRVRLARPEGAIRTVAGSGVISGRGADGGPALLAPLWAPLAAIADPRGTIYLADSLHHRILVLDAAGAARTLAGNGTQGYSGDGGAAAQAQLNEPSALALDAAGNLYIADAGNHAIRKVDSAGIITTVAGTGKAGFSGDGVAALKAALDTPRGVALDGDRNLYIADSGNHRVRRVGPDGIITTLAGTGVAGFCGDDGPAAAACLNYPWSVLLDGSGNVYVADTLNHRVRKLMPFLEPEPVEYVASVELWHAATLKAGPVAPGQLLGVRVPAGAKVLFDGVAAQQISSSTVLAPAAFARSTTTVEVLGNGGLLGRAEAPVVAAAPGLFTLAGGSGQAAAFNEDGARNGPDRPAPRGSLISLFGTGDGGLRPVVRIAGHEAEIVWSGPAPGLPGVFQINARVPSGFAPFGTLEVDVAAGGAVSPPGVTIAVSP
ncbi:MAG: hypothetical protein ACE15B_03595 [Bryobacteraceae bacterium]